MATALVRRFGVRQQPGLFQRLLRASRFGVGAQPARALLARIIDDAHPHPARHRIRQRFEDARMTQIVDGAVNGIVSVVEECRETGRQVGIQSRAPRLKIATDALYCDSRSIYGYLECHTGFCHAVLTSSLRTSAYPAADEPMLELYRLAVNAGRQVGDGEMVGWRLKPRLRAFRHKARLRGLERKSGVLFQRRICWGMVPLLDAG